MLLNGIFSYLLWTVRQTLKRTLAFCNLSNYDIISYRSWKSLKKKWANHSKPRYAPSNSSLRSQKNLIPIFQNSIIFIALKHRKRRHFYSLTHTHTIRYWRIIGFGRSSKASLVRKKEVYWLLYFSANFWIPSMTFWPMVIMRIIRFSLELSAASAEASSPPSSFFPVKNGTATVAIKLKRVRAPRP